MELAPAAIAAIAGGVQVAGSLVSGFSQSAQSHREAAIEEANAQVAEQQAAADAASIRNKAIRLHGQQLAASGASGVLASGFADAIADSDIEAELDARTAEYDGRLKAAGLQSQAAASRRSANSAIASGIFGAGTDALSAYGNWKSLSTPDAPVLSSAPPSVSPPGMKRFLDIF